MKLLDRIYPYLLLAPALLPLVIWNGVVYPYLVPKTLSFYAVTFVTLATFGILLTYGRAFYFARLREKITWIPAILLVIAYGTSAIGVDFYRSFWSTFIRGDGLLMLTCVTSSFYLLLLSADRALYERFLRLVGWTASVVALYGIGEWLIEGGRIGGLLGNAAFFAGYLGVAFFVTLLAAQTYRQSPRNWLYAGAIVQVIAIILSATRGTILALILAGVGYLGMRSFSRGEQGSLLVTRKRAAGALLALVLLGGATVSQRNYFADSSFAPLARIASISLQDETVANRFFVWGGMFEEIQKRPWTGVGAEHIDVLFNRIYDPTKISEQWFDRAHNAFLDYAAQYGAFGLIAYLALIGLYFRAAWRARTRGENETATILLLLGVTYSVQNFFVFDTISSFWLFVALLALLQVSEGDIPSRISFGPRARGFSIVVTIIIAAALIPITIRPAMAAYGIAHAYTYQVTNVEKSVQYLEWGTALGTYGDLEYGYHVYDMYVHVQLNYLKGESLARAYATATSILTENFYQYPYDGRTALYLAHVLGSAPEGVEADDELLLGALERAVRLSPKRAQSWFILSNVAIENANQHPVGSKERVMGYAGAYELLSQYIALVPEFSMPYFVRAELLDASGDKERALQDALKGKEVYRSDAETARRAVGFFIRKEMLPETKFFLEDLVRLEPEDLPVQYDLAKVNFLLGDKDGALSIVRELRNIDPSILASDEAFLEAITSYERTK
jgi:O-antigen ligase